MNRIALLLLAVPLAGAGPGTVVRLADPAVTESSGVVASRRNPGVYWTHNDSGDGPFLYAFDGEGRRLGRWRVRGSSAVDWEDIAIGPGPVRGRPYLYVGDIGDNNRVRRHIVVYRFTEPDARQARCGLECSTEPATAIRLRYPDGPHNSEALLVHPRTGDLYIVSKTGGGDRVTTVYKALGKEIEKGSATLAEIAILDIPEPLFLAFGGGITGGDISPDGTRVVLCDYFRIYEAELPEKAEFDAIWEQPFQATIVGLGIQMEGVCYRRDGKAIMATAEGMPCPLYEIGWE